MHGVADLMYGAASVAEGTLHWCMPSVTGFSLFSLLSRILLTICDFAGREFYGLVK
jgi:hypothetical protein